MNARRSTTRAAHCRRMAMETYALAERTDEPQIIGAYVDIASQWLRLAGEAERDIASPLPGKPPRRR